MNTGTDKVQVRIKNSAGHILENVTIGNIAYGDIFPGQSTEYKTLDQPIYAGFCTFTLDSVQSFAGVGVCGTPPPSPFSSGYYTFKILPVNNGYYPIDVVKR